MPDYQKYFIDNLKYYRKQKGISQSQLAEACDVSNGTIGNIECGITKPSFDLILLISDRLGIKPELLFHCNEHVQFDSKIINTSFTKQQIHKIKRTLTDAVNDALKNLETSE